MLHDCRRVETYPWRMRVRYPLQPDRIVIAQGKHERVVGDVYLYDLSGHVARLSRFSPICMARFAYTVF